MTRPKSVLDSWYKVNQFDENEQGWEGDRPESIEEKIAYTGDVQFGWELLAVK